MSSTWILRSLDVLFVVFHTALIVFNLIGWAFRLTRVWNMVALVLTGASWFILGIFYGIGYCPFTDWHWRVLAALGETDLPRSYITYLFSRLLGVVVEPETAEVVTVLGFFIALLVSLAMNLRDRLVICKRGER
ncbi:MAG: DUF2784 family protein [Spirochaetaceae bacterium]|nr:MAG: DUF2784 family protein [Spirochaetaceae bacterium]